MFLSLIIAGHVSLDRHRQTDTGLFHTTYLMSMLHTAEADTKIIRMVIIWFYPICRLPDSDSTIKVITAMFVRYNYDEP